MRMLLLMSVSVLSLFQSVYTDDEGRQDEEQSWSSLGFLTDQSSNQEDNTVLDASTSNLYMHEVLPESDGPEGRIQRYRKRKNRFRGNRRPVPYLDYEDERQYENSIDRDGTVAYGYDAPTSGYAAPSTGGGYKAPSASYEAPSYTAPTYSAPSYSGGGSDTFNDFLNALAAFLPIGLFLAAIPPNLIVINSARKRRSDDSDLNEISNYSYPFMEKIGKLGLSGLKSNNCQRRLFCEMAVFGTTEDGNSVQRGMSYLADWTPNLVSDMLHTTDVFQAVREENCAKFSCSAF